MAHEPIQFGPEHRRPANDAEVPVTETDVTPVSLELKRDEALTVRWSDGVVSRYPVAMLRKMSPAADAKAWREEQAGNPLAVLPESMAGGSGPITAESAELVGTYALRICFSDGHTSGLYAWGYLRSLPSAD